MMFWIVLAYVLLGIGTARGVVARTVANDVCEYLTRHEKVGTRPAESVQDGIDWSWQHYGPLNIAMGFGAIVFWPLVVAWRLVLEPFGTVVGPMAAKWWHAPRDRALRKAGLL